MKKIDFSNNKKFMIKGARFSSLCANIKYKDRLDLTLIFLEAGSIVTGVFTNSKTKAPSVIWSKKVVKSASKNEARTQCKWSMHFELHFERSGYRSGIDFELISVVC